MTAPSGPERPGRVQLGQRADVLGLATFLQRLVHFDKTAAVRLQVPPRQDARTPQVLAAFGQPPLGVLAVRTAGLASPPAADASRGDGLDTTVSAGQLLELVDEDGVLGIPESVTGPAWAGVLPPRAGWQPVARLPLPELRAAVDAGVRRFKERVERLDPEQRGREVLDATATEVWDAPLDVSAAPEGLPLRVAHAARAMGFLPAPGAESPGAESPGAADSDVADSDAEPGGVTVLRNAVWWRLRTEAGAIVYRRPSGLSLGPVGVG